MEREHYYIVHREVDGHELWFVRYDGGERESGPHATEWIALDKAVRAAHLNGPAMRSQVLVQDAATNEWRTAWAYGEAHKRHGRRAA